jgi:hypothetical protein
MSTTADVLDLSAISPPHERCLVRTKKNPDGLKPDGSEYELANLEDFSPVQIANFNTGVQEAEALWALEKPGKPDTARMEQLFTDLAAMVILGAPRADVAQLPLVSRRGVMLRFWATLSLTTYSAMGEKALTAMAEMARRVNTGSGRS